jgi:hypothetical protein
MSRLKWPPIIEQTQQFVPAQPVQPDLRDCAWPDADGDLSPDDAEALAAALELAAD